MRTTKPWRDAGATALALSLCPIPLGCAPSSSEIASSHEVEIEWGACPFSVDDRIRCGSIAVPEDWSRAEDSRQIRLSFAVIAAGDAERKADDPVAFLTGGPGFSAFASLRELPSVPLSETRDFVVMEPRGYGYSEPALLCESVATLAECHARWEAEGVDPNQYTTEASVRDLEALRAALAFDQWNVFGVSYGTFWASHYLRMFPGSLRSVIMDSPYPPHAGYDWNRPGALNAFERMFNDCRANPACNTAYPDLRRRFIEALRSLRDTPISVEGQTIEFPDAFGMMYGSIYLTPSMRRTPLMIDALARGDHELFVEVGAVPPLDFPEGIDFTRTSAMGLNASVMCAEDIPFPAAPETRTAFTAPWPEDIVQMITPEGWDYDERCAAWPVERADPVLNSPVTTDVPTIVLVGAYDPITPPEFAEAMLLTMSRGTLVLNPSAAHALFADSNQCVHDILVDFTDAPEERVDVSCLANVPRVHWILPDEWPTGG